jgi:hypothetical protein
MDEKMGTLDVNFIWELMVLPKDKKAIMRKRVYKVKHYVNGFVIMYKERLIAKVYAQTFIIEYKSFIA